jgi:UDP-glucose 4-epimerase
MNVLVIGGAGYIGSHMVKLLLKSGHSVVVLDNFSTGHRDAILGGDVIEGDLADGALLDRIFRGTRFDGVMHFASSIQVGESVEKPVWYYRNNVANTLNLLEAMQGHQVGSLIFSSSAAVFGEPERIPIDERHPTNPINPYGMSKLMVERILLDVDRAHRMRSVSLRYFNASGADPGGLLGERHNPQIHLIPRILECVSAGRQYRCSGATMTRPTARASATTCTLRTSAMHISWRSLTSSAADRPPRLILETATASAFRKSSMPRGRLQDGLSR